MTTRSDLDNIVTSMEKVNERAYFTDYYLHEYHERVLLQRVQGPRILEMGCGEGAITKMLGRNFPEVVSVDGSRILIEKASKHVNMPNVVFSLSLFEEFVPDGKFSSILMICILEHVDDPVLILKRAKEWLEPEGKIYIIVPNALSLNRQVGKAMGMLKELNELHERDILVGHRRVYDPKRLLADIKMAGLKEVFINGILLKPLSDAQMQTWDKKLIEAFYEVGKNYPSICTEIYAECRPKQAA
jgi:2-polyprenyl-3-methyl-5-hydroxy-6-metoxy-1,4-benzoquinol methylase